MEISLLIFYEKRQSLEAIFIDANPFEILYEIRQRWCEIQILSLQIEDDNYHLLSIKMIMMAKKKTCFCDTLLLFFMLTAGCCWKVIARLLFNAAFKAQ